jgi:cold shock CspA family protein
MKGKVIRLTGKVTRYFPERAFGFILADDGQSYFLHVSQIQDDDPIQVGDRFSFQPKSTEKGLVAVNCTRITE